MIDKSIQAKIRAGFEKSEDEADRVLGLINDQIPFMILACVEQDPSRPTQDQLCMALKLAYTIDLSIPAKVVRDRRCMEEFLREHGQDLE